MRCWVIRLQLCWCSASNVIPGLTRSMVEHWVSSTASYSACCTLLNLPFAGKVLVMSDALIKSIEVYVENLDLREADLDLRSKHFSRALTIIYSLQSSLDFEKGGDIADNLFQTYEFARQMIIGSIKDMDETGPKRALALLTEIREAWAQMGEQLSNDK